MRLQKNISNVLFLILILCLILGLDLCAQENKAFQVDGMPVCFVSISENLDKFLFPVIFILVVIGVVVLSYLVFKLKNENEKLERKHNKINEEHNKTKQDNDDLTKYRKEANDFILRLKDVIGNKELEEKPNLNEEKLYLNTDEYSNIIKKIEGAKNELIESISAKNELIDKQEDQLKSLIELFPEEYSVSQNTGPIDMDSLAKSTTSELNSNAKYFYLLEKKINKVLKESNEGGTNNAKKGDVGASLPEKEEQVVGQNLFRELYKNIREKELELEKDGFSKDRENVIIINKEVQKWKKNFVKFQKTFENELYYKFLEILEEEEKYRITTDKHVMIVPYDNRNFKNNIMTLKNINEKIQNIDDENINKLPGIAIRKSVQELDLRIKNDPNIPESVNMFLKKSLETIVIILKKLKNSRKELHQYLGNVLGMDENEQLKNIDYKGIVDVLGNSNIVDEKMEIAIDDLLSKGDAILAGNFKLFNNLNEQSDKLRKNYFSLINKTVINTYNNLFGARRNFENKIETEYLENTTYLRKWITIYDQLMRVVEDYLSNELNIEKIPTKIRDKYNGDIHNPIDEAIKNPDFPDETIFFIERCGFHFDDGEKKYLVKSVDVLVVKNL